MKQLFLVLFLVFLVACAAEVTEEAEVMEDDNKETEAEQEETTEEQEEVMEEAVKEPTGEGEENLDALRDSLGVADRTRVFPTSQKVSKGDSYIFAYGVTNPSNKPFVAYRVIEFKEAKDRVSNTIFVDSDFMMRWIVSDVAEVIEIPSVDIAVSSIEVKVKNEIAEGEDVPPGNYEFTVITYDNASIHRDDWDVYHRIDFTVRVN